MFAQQVSLPQNLLAALDLCTSHCGLNMLIDQESFSALSVSVDGFPQYLGNVGLLPTLLQAEADKEVAKQLEARQAVLTCQLHRVFFG